MDFSLDFMFDGCSFILGLYFGTLVNFLKIFVFLTYQIFFFFTLSFKCVFSSLHCASKNKLLLCVPILKFKNNELI